MEIIILFLLYIGVSWAVANISKEREIGFWTLMATSFILTPIVALLIGLFAKKKKINGDYMLGENDEKSTGVFSNIFNKKAKGTEDNLEMPDFGGGISPK
ncbi:MAG: hypothetical protein ACKPAD_08205 [Bacteroidota bacterium]